MVMCLMLQNMHNPSEYDDVWVVDEVDGGIAIKRGRKYIEGQQFPVTDVWLSLPDGTTHPIKKKYLRHRSDAPAFLRLWEETGGFPIEPGEDMVPVDVALEGRAAMAVYLNIVGEMTREEVAERMNLRKDTIRTYISEYRRGER